MTGTSFQHGAHCTHRRLQNGYDFWFRLRSFPTLSHVPAANGEIADDFSPHLYNEDGAESPKSLPSLLFISTRTVEQGAQNTCESTLVLICGWGVVPDSPTPENVSQNKW